MDKDGIGLFPICVSHELRDLSNIPHRDIPGTDLAIVAGYRGVIDDAKKALHMPAEEIFAAIDKEKPLFKLTSLAELLDISEEESADAYVFSTEDGVFGAAVLWYTEELKRVAENFGEGFYIFPASVHEVILLPDSRAEHSDPKDFQLMISEINESQVKEEDRLSNSLYHFDGEKLSVAAGPAEQKEDSDNGK